eukprot:2289582-Prymnesium_polylepis.1
MAHPRRSATIAFLVAVSSSSGLSLRRFSAQSEPALSSLRAENLAFENLRLRGGSQSTNKASRSSQAGAGGREAPYVSAKYVASIVAYAVVPTLLRLAYALAMRAPA